MEDLKYESCFNPLDFPYLKFCVIAVTASTAFSKILFCQATKRLYAFVLNTNAIVFRLPDPHVCVS